MTPLKFTFADAAAADLIDLTRIGVIAAATADGREVVVEPEDEWMTVSNARFLLVIFRLTDRMAVSAA